MAFPTPGRSDAGRTDRRSGSGLRRRLLSDLGRLRPNTPDLGVAMKHSAPRRGTAAGAVTTAPGASRHLRLVEPPTLSTCSDGHSRGLPTPAINRDLDVDDPPLTVLAW